MHHALPEPQNKPAGGDAPQPTCTALMLGTTRPWGVAMATPMLTWRWQITVLWSADMLALTKGQLRSARPAACRGGKGAHNWSGEAAGSCEAGGAGWAAMQAWLAKPAERSGPQVLHSRPGFAP